MNELPRFARPVPIDSRPAPKETDDDLPMRPPVADERPRGNGPQEIPGLAMNGFTGATASQTKADQVDTWLYLDMPTVWPGNQQRHSWQRCAL